jgi:TPP-dependent pyruvate/acetoin dehydrogenase alpha subunit
MLFGIKFRIQLPQAVGAAYSLKMDGKSACAVTFCGDGATSEVSDDEHEHFLLRK